MSDKAELCLPTGIVGGCLKDVDMSRKTVVLKRETLHDRLSLFVWGGKDYLEDVQNNTYEQAYVTC